MQYIENEELMHYGVLGMKWRIHKNPSKAFSKSVKKANRLDKKIANAERDVLRAAKKRDKARSESVMKTKYLKMKLANAEHDVSKAVEKRNEALKSYSEFKFNSEQKDANNVARHQEATRKLDKATKKSQKWKQHMQTNFQNVKVSDIDPEVRSAGKDYIDMLMKG